MRIQLVGIRYFRTVIIAFICIILLSATGGYVHGNSLGQMVANHMPLGGLFFLIILVFILNPFLKKLGNKAELSTSELALIWIMTSFC